MKESQVPIRTHDEDLLPTGVYSCLAGLEKRTAIYRASPSLFTSLLRLYVIDNAGGVVFDCMTRDPKTKQAFEQIRSTFHAHDLTAKIPPYKECTEADRTNFRDWLYKASHLKTTFIYAERGDVRSMLTGNSFVTRVVRYLGKTESRPKRVIILEAGMESLLKSPLPRLMIETPIPLYSVVIPKTDTVGIFVSPAVSVLSSSEKQRLLIEFWRRSATSVVINMSSTPFSSSQSVSRVFEEGPNRLPLRTVQEAKVFYSRVLDILFQALSARKNVCVLDNQHLGAAATLITFVLISMAKMTVVDATNVTRVRLCPPEFDAYALAAFSHLQDLGGEMTSPQDRHAKALECLAARFADEDKSDASKSVEQDKKTGATDDNLLKGATIKSLSEKWHEIEELMKRENIVQREKAKAFELLSRLFNKVLQSPAEPTYRTVKTSNPKFKDMGGNSTLVKAILTAGGWVSHDGAFSLPESARIQDMRDLLVYMSNVM